MTVSACAKVNFTLDVFAPRGDGYHALRSVVMPIALADTLELEESDSFESDSGYPDDLCLRAARAYDADRGVRIRVTKRIPAGGGLGGGSADAAAVLVALEAMRGRGLSRAELAELGARVGSDVPALVMGGPVLMEGRGERVTPIVAPRFDLVVVNPGVNCSTCEVYKRCESRPASASSPTDAMLSALTDGDFRRVVAALSNDLETPAMAMHHEIAAAKAVLVSAGADGVLMSGSGSSVFGIVENEAAAKSVAEKMSASGYLAWATHTVA